MSLVDDICQKEAVGDDVSPGVHGGPDDLGGQLRPARHEEKRLARRAHVAAAVKKQAAQDVADPRPARIGALCHVVAARAQPLGQQPALSRFAGAVQTIQGKKQGV